MIMVRLLSTNAAVRQNGAFLSERSTDRLQCRPDVSIRRPDVFLFGCFLMRTVEQVGTSYATKLIKCLHFIVFHMIRGALNSFVNCISTCFPKSTSRDQFWLAALIRLNSDNS